MRFWGVWSVSRRVRERGRMLLITHWIVPQLRRRVSKQLDLSCETTEGYEIEGSEYDGVQCGLVQGGEGLFGDKLYR